LETLDEFVRVLTGGASLEELLQIAREESQNPTITTEIIVDDSCHKNGEIPAT